MDYIGRNNARPIFYQMIERYSLTVTADKIRERFSVDVPGSYKQRYNAAPTQLLPVITSADPAGISTFYWGTSPEWSKNKLPSEKMVNVRAEALAEKPALKRAMMKMRCIVPADGFYAWKKIGKKTQIPHRFLLKDSEVFSMAGIWEEFDDEEGNSVHTFMIMTVAANETVTTVYDRMPVMLDKESERIWLDQQATESDLTKLLIPYASSKISMYTVSPRISEIEHDLPSFILPAPPADQFGNLTLFD
jgi:putative SOS response-associated peptidase YedK